MSTTVQPHFLTSLCCKIKTKVLTSIVPLHARRAYFMASLAKYLCDNNVPENVLAENVAAAMNHLVSPRSLVYFFNKKGMWRDIPRTVNEDEKDLNYTQLATIVELVVKATPDWLKYSNIRSMKKDAQLAALAAFATNHSTTFQRKLVQTYHQYLEQPKPKGIVEVMIFGK